MGRLQEAITKMRNLFFVVTVILIIGLQYYYNTSITYNNLKRYLRVNYTHINDFVSSFYANHTTDKGVELLSNKTNPNKNLREDILEIAYDKTNDTDLILIPLKRPKRRKLRKTKAPNSTEIVPNLFRYDLFLAWRKLRGSFEWGLGYQKRKYPDGTPPCLSDKTKFGSVEVNKTIVSLASVEKQISGVELGGIYAPPNCHSKHKVAILIAYRNRADNLAIFLRHIHPFLKKQLLEYAIFVVEQYGNEKFNKGYLYNIGYMVTQLLSSWTCLIFHDVDLLPLDERILYKCARRPTHMSSAVEMFGFNNSYRTMFGGVTSMTPQQYEAVNGYSNYYFDWGAEDDDMFVRLKCKKMSIYRISKEIGRYASLPHQPTRKNPKRLYVLSQADKRFWFEGLSSVEFTLQMILKHPLYTHLRADINPFNLILPYSV